MAEWRTIGAALGFIFLCFFGIPIHVNKPESENKLLFDTFVVKYNKSYLNNETEFILRFENFQISLKVIEQLNMNRTDGRSAIYGITEFSDLTPEEFIIHYLQKDLPERIKYTKKHKVSKHRHSNKSMQTDNIHNSKHDLYSSSQYYKMVTKRSLLPQRLDWREKRIVTPVRNQGLCGACWAHSSISTIESMSALESGVLRSLSVQQMVDCAGGNMGCNGGDTCTLLAWLTGTQTEILPESDYPLNYYESSNQCQRNVTRSTSEVSVKVNNFTCYTLADAEQSILQLLSHGPLTAAVNALTWQNYLGGVIQFHCDGDMLFMNHAVQIVGYDLTKPVPFYIVRNSWGTLFGDKGYLYIAIGKNLCGIANEVSSIKVIVNQL